MIGAWQELHEHGELTPKFGRLLYATVDAVRRVRHFPPPNGASRWDTETVADVAHDYLADRPTMGRLRRMAKTATSEDSFERLLNADIANWFLMQARATDTGATLEALKHSIEQNERILSQGDSPQTRTWVLQDHDGKPGFTGDPRALVEAAYAVDDVRPMKWRPDAVHRQPIAEPDSLRRVIEAILDAAGGPLTPKQLLEVIRARFPATAEPTIEEPIQPDHVNEDVAGPVDDAPSPDDVIVADAIWVQLDLNAKLVLGIVDDSVRPIADATGLSRGTAHRAIQASQVLLTSGLRGHQNPDAVMRLLKDWSATIRSGGTDPRGSASSTGEEDTGNG